MQMLGGVSGAVLLPLQWAPQENLGGDLGTTAPVYIMCTVMLFWPSFQLMLGCCVQMLDVVLGAALLQLLRA